MSAQSSTPEYESTGYNLRYQGDHATQEVDSNQDILPCNQTKQENKRRWRKVLHRVGLRTLNDEFSHLANAREKAEFKVWTNQYRYGHAGNSPNQACAPSRRMETTSLRSSPSCTLSSTSTSSTSSVKDTLKKARRSFLDEVYFAKTGIDRKDFDMQRRKFGYHGGFEERLWDPIFGR